MVSIPGEIVADEHFIRGDDRGRMLPTTSYHQNGQPPTLQESGRGCALDIWERRAVHSQTRRRTLEQNESFERKCQHDAFTSFLKI